MRYITLFLILALLPLTLHAQESQILICDLVYWNSHTGSLLDSIYSEHGYNVERIHHIPESDSFPEATIIWAGIAEYGFWYEFTYAEIEKIIEGLASGKNIWGMGEHSLFAAGLWEWFGFVVLTLDTEPIDSLYGEEFLTGLTWSYNERPMSTIAIMGLPGMSVLDTGPSYPWHMGWRGVAYADSVHHYKTLALNVDLSRIVEVDTLATVEDFALKVMCDWFELWPSGVEEGEGEILPAHFYLSSYPNPFNAQTVIRCDVPQAGEISLSIYNLSGQKVSTLFEGFKSPGTYEVLWKPRDLPSGIYFAVMKGSNAKSSCKLCLMK